MPNWTDEQLQAINAFGHPVIVSAAAGSGKTAVLVERAVRILCDEALKIPADTLLAVTFTKEAAGQMREKLEAALEAELDKNPDNEWINRQISLLRLAEICTINSFCYDLVRNNLPDTEFQSGVRIADENEIEMICNRALDIVMEEAYEQRPYETEMLFGYLCTENDTNLRALVLQLRTFLRTLPFSNAWANNIIKSFENGIAIENAINHKFNLLDEELMPQFVSAINELEASIQKLVNYSSAQSSLSVNLQYAKSIANAIINRNWDDSFNGVHSVKWASVRNTQTKAEAYNSGFDDQIAYEEAKEKYAEIKRIATALKKEFTATYSDITIDAEITLKIFKSLLNLCNELEKQIMLIKVEKNCMDFADTELTTVKLLLNCDENGNLSRTKFCEEIRNSGRYKLIIIDEFQDVNNLQDVIFKAVSNTDDLSVIGGNVFVVGDVKQAIYRFRHANPTIFINTRKQAKSGRTDVEEILLKRNFRSRNNVLNLANYIFSSVMCEEVGELEYTKEELVYGELYSGTDPASEIIVSNYSENDDKAKLEYQAAARKIKQMIADGVTVKDGDNLRPCRPNDFCIISRNHASKQLSECFEAEGLSIASNEKTAYIKSREISLLLSLLSVISNPMHNIELASVMLSPLMGFDDNELTIVKTKNRHVRIYKNMLEIADEPENPLYAKCKKAVNLIKKLRVYSASLSVSRLIKKVYDLTDMVSIAGVYQNGKQKSANLNLMLEYARSYEESSADGLSGFLRYIDYLISADKDFNRAIIVSESENAVNFNTIHGSKGLEYPFVILCGMTKNFNKKDIRRAMCLHVDGGFSIVYSDYKTLTKHITVFSDYLKDIGDDELMSEELRLLYVALTRAKEKLIMIMSFNDKNIERVGKLVSQTDSEKIAPIASRKAVCMQDWVVLALSKHPDFDIVRNVLESEAFISTLNIPEIEITEPLESVTDEIAVEHSFKADENAVNAIKQSFAFEYDARLVDKDAKISVSEIVKDDSLTFFPQVPKLDDALEELSATQKGTIMHRFMQLANYENAESNAEAEIERLVKLNAFTVKEANSINVKCIKDFFETDIYSRMKKSKCVMREKQFLVKMNDIKLPQELEKAYAGTDGMLQGIADCIFEEPDGYIIVDYKTDRIKNVSQLIERYSMQLGFYKAAFDILLDKPVKSAYIYSLYLAEGVEAEIEKFSENISI